MMRLTDEQYLDQGMLRIESAMAELDRIFETFPAQRRSKVRKMMEGPVGNQFLTAPASSRRSYHYAFPGGLLLHSLNVVKNLQKIVLSLAPNRWDIGTLNFVGIFHDLGKAGTAGNPNYTPTKEEWKRRRGEFFEISKNDFMPNAEKGLFILQQNFIELSHEEYAAIRLNDGMGTDENRGYAFREPPLALFVHWADHWASVEEKEEDS